MVIFFVQLKQLYLGKKKNVKNATFESKRYISRTGITVIQKYLALIDFFRARILQKKKTLGPPSVAY